MRSLTEVTIGQPIFGEYGVKVPVRFIYSDDDNDDGIKLPSLFEDNLDFHFTYRTMQKGTDVIRELVSEWLEEARTNYAASGFEKYQAAVDKFLTNTDFPSLAKHWFEDPESSTIH